MRAISDLAASLHHMVTGSDAATTGHRAEFAEGADLVVYTNAVPSDAPELVRARELGIPVIERAEYLGELSRRYGKTIAVAGCHGKSTATAMTGAALSSLRPTVHVGVAGASICGGSACFITEACEYNRSFLHLAPDIGVILNIDYDHPDCYGSEAELFDAYVRFAKQCKTLIVNGDDFRCAGIGGVTFGYGEKNDYRAVDVRNENGFRKFSLTAHGKACGQIELTVPGAHNVYNALAAFAAASELGVKPREAREGLNAVRGIPRRVERLGTVKNRTVFTDYAHHPAEIEASVSLAKEMFGTAGVVFQPHTYTRTRALKERFAEALSKFDEIALLPVFAAREKPSDGANSDVIAKILAQSGKLAYEEDKNTVAARVDSFNSKAIVFMGAGDVDAIARRYVSRN